MNPANIKRIKPMPRRQFLALTFRLYDDIATSAQAKGDDEFFKEVYAAKLTAKKLIDLEEMEVMNHANS